jgi:phage-related protein
MGDAKWSVNLLDQAASEFLEIPSGLQAKLLRLLDVVEEEGIQGVPVKRKKHLKGRIWEFRASAVEGIARALYCVQDKNTAFGLVAIPSRHWREVGM